jgi:hypothetical protein
LHNRAHPPLHSCTCFRIAGGPVCIGGRLLVFGENDSQRFFQIYDCATLHELYAGPHPKPTQYAHQDAIRLAKTFIIPVPADSGTKSGVVRTSELQLFTGCYHYSQRWSLAAVVATPAGPPGLLNEYRGTGNAAGSTHDFQVITEQQGQRDEVDRPLFVAADEQSIRVFDLAKPRCIKKALSGWVQQLLPATSSSSDGKKQQRLVCTGASLCGQESIWSVSSSAIEQVSSPQLPSKGWRLVQHPTTPGRYFGINDSKIVELELDVSMPSREAADWRSAKWKIVRKLGDLGDRQQPWLSPEGRLYSFGRDGMNEWAW